LGTPIDTATGGERVAVTAATARSVRLERPERVEVVDGPVPEPGRGEILVKVGAAGLCGSDLELYEGRRPDGYYRYPVVPGHEWAGTVAALGPGAGDRVQVGDPVVAEGVRRCGRCARCREGRTNLCLAPYAETGFTHPGAFSDYVVVPADLVHRLPPGADLEHAALLEPAACVAAGLLASPPTPGSRVAVIGAGTLGLLATAMARLQSPAELVVLDPRGDRREVARRLGATEAIAPTEDGPQELEADLVIETAGAGTTVPAALAAARRGGRVIILGIAGRGEVTLDPDVLSLGNLSVQGIFGAPSAAWQNVVRLFAAGLLETGPLISHRLGLGGYLDALELVGRPGTGKVLLIPRNGDG
jgi:threonine dehydrogenase-like Zn-dependent dehydrogenase